MRIMEIEDMNLEENLNLEENQNLEENLNMEENQNLDVVLEPKVGTLFNSEDEAKECYSTYAKSRGEIEAGGPDNLRWIDKDARNRKDKQRRLQLKEGDAEAMHKYFVRMQKDNGDFFYVIDHDEDYRLRNVFWADARSRELYKEFGESNDWLAGLYEERHRWVPAFLNDIFWAGMSSTQQSESMNSYFDGYIHSNTTLKEFVEQYDNALHKKVQKEEEANARSLNVQIQKVSYVNWNSKPEFARYDGLLKLFNEAADKAMYSIAKTHRMADRLREIKAEIDLDDKECVSNMVTVGDAQIDMESFQDKSITLGDPSKGPRRGRPPTERKQSVTEQTIRKNAKSNKRQCSRANAKSIPDVEVHTHATGFDGIITQEGETITPS
ncbi:hypothetical protein RHMOL_Rhmol01G0270100 [Rhododendron molle]|uniref:Uncharacterized protein n=1 Tax=Rhododendron molle TaxID=49168 RepID=A0ACC0Q5R1_RHOML|nr:hypothetical protein RHMOL_Rhmol01G0270100 [Rhododendron molle]